MSGVVLSLAQLAGRTGRGIRVAVVDSGVHVDHPHVGSVIGGVAIDAQGQLSNDLMDRLGHGTAVTAAINEKAPDAQILAVRIFDRALSASGLALITAIRWAAGQQAQLINLSLGTVNEEHREALRAAVVDAASLGAVVVAAAPEPGRSWLPGALPGVVAVRLDWNCPRDQLIATVEPGRDLEVRASGYPRPIPGVEPERNLRGTSFSVANATGLLALLLEGQQGLSIDQIREMLKGSDRRKTL